MIVQNIQPTNFDSRSQYITPKMSKNIHEILTLMNLDKKRILKGDYYKVSVIKKLKHLDTSFEDHGRTTKNIPPEKIMGGFSTLTIGETTLEIDNHTGEIYDSNKPFYKPWFYVLKQAEKALDTFLTNFYNPKIVEKEIIPINEPTPECSKKIQKLVLETEKQRLEEVVQKLEKI